MTIATRSLGAVVVTAGAASLLVAGAVLAAPGFLDTTLALDPATRSLRAQGSLTLPAGDATEIRLGAALRVDAVKLDGRALSAQSGARDGGQVWTIDASTRERRIEVVWSGVLAPLDRDRSHRDTLRGAGAHADPRGSFLPGAAVWHPLPAAGLSGYRVRLELPAGQKGLVPGRMLEESEQGGRYRARFEYAHPIDGIELMAGPYDVTHRDATLASGKAVRLRTYFAPALRELADSYLAAVRRYLDLYEGWIGEYAFSEFSVVSSPTPTGFGMPTLTYLGEDVLRLPFIRDSSLGHEVLHNWWGNGVRPDYARGNWSEALTTFMADYTYREQAGADAARAMRLEWLRDLAALPGSEDRPIAAFTGRYHGASQIIGYHKPAMVFSMLRDRIGRDAFDRGVQRFWREHRHRVASWGDLRHAFEAASGQTLQAFFAQWLTRTGLPAVRITQADVTAAASVHRLRVTLAQDAPTFALQLPLVIRTAGGESMHLIDLQGAERTIEFDLAERPRSLVLDPELRALRRLDAREAPPILRSVMVDSASVLVVPTSDPPLIEAARALGSRLFDHVPALADERGRRPDAPFLVVGMHADVDAWLTRNGLAARPPSLSRSGDAHVWMARGADARAYGVVSLANAQALAAVTRLLPHYGRQSWVSFAGGKVTERGVWPARPVEWTLD